MSKLFVIVGETSADMHTSHVLRELAAIDPTLEVYGVGGDECQAAGMRLIAHQRDLSVYGAFELVVDIPRVLRVFFRLLFSIGRERPDAVMFVDLPDFNIWMGRLIRLFYGRKIPMIYFISPQVWIWRKRRIYTLKRLVSKMLVIFPFEEKAYRDIGVDVEFVGHPLVDSIPEDLSREEARKRLGIDADSQVVAILPGSRAGEVKTHLPVLIAAVQEFIRRRKSSGVDTPLTVLLPRAPSLKAELIDGILAETSVEVRTFSGQVHDVIRAADVALVKLGTAVLETGLIGTPVIAIGRITAISYFIGWHVLRIQPDLLSLINIVLNRRAVPEYIQAEFNGNNLADAIEKVLANPKAGEEENLLKQELRKCLAVSEEGVAQDESMNETVRPTRSYGARTYAGRAAHAILDVVRKENL